MALPKLCFVAPNLYPVFAKLPGTTMVGGAEIQQCFLIREFLKRGYQISVISADFGQGAEQVVEGVRFIRMFEAAAGLPVLRALHPRMTGIWCALRRADADVYYNRCASMALALVTEFCRRHKRVSIFAGASDLDFVPGRELIRSPWYRAMFRFGLRRVDHIVVQNPSQTSLCREHFGRESVLIPSVFVPPSSDQPASISPREILWCGVLRENKRVELFLRLVELLPQYQFRIVGGPDSSSYSSKIAANIEELCLNWPNLSYDGYLAYDAADAKFRDCRVFVNTSAREGFPNTFLQAWSRRIPTVSFVDVGARLDGAPVGAVCESMDSMIHAIRSLMDDNAAYAEQASIVGEYFSSNHTVEAGVSKYEGVIIGALATG